MKLKAYATDTGIVLVTDPAILPTCTLKKMRSDCGHWSYQESKTWIGKEYKYAPATRAFRKILNTRTGDRFECETVLVYDEDGHFGQMPTECLEFGP